jgi:hypothetical protein
MGDQGIFLCVKDTGEQSRLGMAKHYAKGLRSWEEWLRGVSGNFVLRTPLDQPMWTGPWKGSDL